MTEAEKKARLEANHKKIKEEEKLREEIENDFDYCYQISAGAGAGKTQLVVNRITRQLESGKYEPQELAAITFTNKAAQEIRERIAGNLSKAAADDPSNSIIRNALDNIGRMQISTIHSFCHRILKENTFKGKLRMDFELLEEKDASAMKETFFKDWFVKHADEYNKLNQSLQGHVKYSDLFSNFSSICELPETTFIYEAYDNVKPEKVEVCDENVVKAADAVVAKFKTVFESCLSSMSEGTSFEGLHYIDGSIDGMLNAGFTSDSSDEDLLSKILSKKNIFNLKAGTAAEKKAKNEIIAAVYDALQPEVDYYKECIEKSDCMKKAMVNTCVLDFLLPAREEYRKCLFNRYISNDLLLQKTNALLDDKDVVEKLRRTFKCIYVDEQQDTDPVQNSLITKICKKDGEYIPGMLFLCGDVKQSIYAFRQSDYRLFNSTWKDFEAHPLSCKTVELSINNRSNSELLDYFNDKAGKIIPSYNPMIPRNGYRSGEGVIHGVYKCIGNTPECEGEPAKIVALIKHLMNNALIADDVKDGDVSYRKITYSDFLILTANARHNDNYVNTLQSSGIPARISLEFSPGQMLPLKRFVHLYSYIVTRGYKKACEGGLSVAQNNTSSKISENIDKLYDQVKVLNGKNAAEIIGWLLEHSELYLYGDDTQLGCNIKRYQMTIRQMVDSVLSETDNNPMAVLEALKEYVTEDNTCDRETVYDKTEDAVRIMNIHKAKGLQGGICIIAQRKGVNDKAVNYTTDKERYQTISFERGHGSIETYSAYEINDAIKKVAYKERDMESDRLEYVAVTRAKEVVIFMGSSARGSEEPMFSKYIDDDIKEILDEFPMPEESKDEEVVSAGEIKHTEEPSSDVTAKASYRISPSTMEIGGSYVPTEETSSVETSDEEGEELEDNSGIELPVSDTAEALQRTLPYGDIFGTVMHRAFELAVHGIRDNDLDVQLCINRAINENNDDIEARYADTADAEKKEFSDYLNSELPKFVDFISNDIAFADEVFTEYHFSLAVTGDDLRDIRSKLVLTKGKEDSLPPAGQEDSQKVWINGQADLVIRKDGKTIVWDYKSDKNNELSLEDFSKLIHSKYDNQMNLYKWVFEKHFGGEVSGRFYSVRIGEIV